MRDPLTVLDLFCGGGGLSEGFRQAGFRLVQGIDKDRWAVEAFSENHPGAAAIQADLLNFDLKSLPQVDVLIGGPPCIEFSASKRGGNGNILAGLLLVQVYLRAVHMLKPKWWVMENVPRITKFLPEKIPLDWIGVRGSRSLRVPTRAVFNSADFGVPQLRRRFLMGNFPLPSPSHRDPGDEPPAGPAEEELPPWRSLGEGLSGLPDPLASPRLSQKIADPNYGFGLAIGELTDHFHECLLDEDELRRLKKAKQLHPFYGNMAFPDEVRRPARTVVATQLGRETLVLTSPGKGLRRATVRECATLQTFPITYQFYGSLGARYRLAGDAVPPLMARAIAEEILRAEGRALRVPHIERRVVAAVRPVSGSVRRKTRGPMRADRKFAEMVPGKEVRGCRVELSNTFRQVDNGAGGVEVGWVAKLYVGEGRAMRSKAVSLEEALGELTGYPTDGTMDGRLRALLRDASESLRGKTQSAAFLQDVWSGRASGPGPLQLVDALSKVIDQHLPGKTFHNVRVPRSGRLDIVPQAGLRVRLAVGLVLTAFACLLVEDAGAGDPGESRTLELELESMFDAAVRRRQPVRAAG